MTRSAAQSRDHEVVRQLQGRIHGMQASIPRTPLATLPALADLLTLRTGGAYEVGSATLALALLAAPSAQGAWTAVVGARDLGVEAAAEMGVDLSRTVLVPEPGDHWLEATAALVDVVSIVLLKPPPGVAERAAGRIAARLRKHSCALVAWGSWPGSEARLDIESSSWTGVDRGHGRLVGRRLVVSVTRGSAPARRTELLLPASGPLVEAPLEPYAAQEAEETTLARAEVG